MPFVHILRAKNTLTDAQKNTLLDGVLEGVVAVEGEAMRTGIGIALNEGIAEASHLRNCVAFVRITVIRAALSPEQRTQMLANVVDAVVAVEGEANRMAVWAVLEESVADGEWSIGGNGLTIAAMNKIKRGEYPWS